MLFHLYLVGKISKKRLLGTARVVAYGLTVSAALGALTIHNAIADVKTESLQLGRKLEGVESLVRGAQEFRLNGQTVYFAASTTQDPVAKVLDRFEAHCDRSRAFGPLEWKSLGDLNHGTPLPENSGMGTHLGVVRTEDASKGDGVVMCFTDDHEKSFLEAARVFGETGDLHAFGNIRYVHATRKGDVTSLRTVWTDGSFNIRSIMGDPTQDAPGSDFATLPRPVDSRRILTAEGVGTPYAARVYSSKASATQVLSTFQMQMEHDGWEWVTSPDTSLDKNNIGGRWFIRPATGEQAVLSVSKDANGMTNAVVGSLSQATTSPLTTTSGGTQ